jgi:beta-phosphoglucomutase-like phosphatase (HAD superfamily)
VNCSASSKFVLISRRFDAVIFDLDGVITDTAALHAAVWKEISMTFSRKSPSQPAANRRRLTNTQRRRRECLRFQHTTHP